MLIIHHLLQSGRRYIKVYKKYLLLLAMIVGLIAISSYTRGNIAQITAVLAGITMIFAGLSLTLWIIQTPSKTDKDAVV